MNWQHIEYFCTAARTENYRKAADEMYVTVSALSRAISSLEEELGVPLFTKNGRNVYLTKYGKAFFEYAKQAMDNIDEGKALMQSMAQFEHGRVAICGIQTMCAQFLPSMIQQFYEGHPQIQLTMGSAICVDVLEQVLEGKADLGFCSDFDVDDKQYSDIEYVLLKIEEFCVVISPNHRFAGLESVSLKDLESEKLVMPRNPQSRNRIAFDEICREQNISLPIAYELPDDSSIMGFVGAGMGVSFMADIPSMHRSDLRSVPIRDLERGQNQYIVWKKSRKQRPAVTMFRDFVLHNT